jgi:hypothetical protein
MINDQLKMTGELHVVVTGKDGLVKEDITIPNLVVTTGKNFVASRMTGSASAVMSHMAIGSGSVTPAVGDTALGTELGRVALTTAGGVATNATVEFIGSFPAGTGTGAVTEAGIFNASSAGTMLCRTTFPVVNKGADDSVAITWRVTVN